MYEELVKRLREHGEFLIASDRMKAPPNVNVRNVFAEDYAQAADAIEELQAGEKKFLRNISALEMENENLKRARRWIPVTERLPDDRRDVQITVFWHDAWRTMYGYYDGAYWHLYAPMHTEVADVYVIGWMEKPAPMPLQKPPKGETWDS